MLKKKIILATMAIMASISTATAAGIGPNGVPIHSMFDVGGSGDLSHTTRHSFETSKIINPKTAKDFIRNNSLNIQNGFFNTGSQTYNTAGIYIFTMPVGFTKLKVIGCGAGGNGEIRTWWSGVASTGGGGSGSCFITILTGETGTQFLFKPAAAGGFEPTQISVTPNLFSRLSALGFNGGRGGSAVYSFSTFRWGDGLAGNGASTTGGTSATYTSVNATGATTYLLATRAKLALAGKAGNGFNGGISTKTFYNSDYSQHCTGGNGGDGVAMGSSTALTATGGGCVMVLW